MVVIYSMIALIFGLLVIGFHQALANKNDPEKYRTELLRLCLGDAQLAARLTMREIQRRPGISERDAIMAAIAAYRRDN